ncbi:MAG: PorP/SprF family type IX secretion system membrane protein [Saprospiraceae bacterium]
MKSILQKITLTCFASAFAIMLLGQDIHFSQSHFSPLNISPGLAGMFSEDVRIMGSYRSQWQSVPVSYLTFSGAADMKLPNLLRGNDKISLAGGVHFNYDKAGDSELSLSSFGVTGAVHYKVNEMNTISLGVQSVASQRSFSISGLQFNNQFDGELYDPTRDSKENFSNENKAFVDVNAGLSWMLKKEDNRSQAIAGIGVYHLTGPVQSFEDDPDSKLPMRLSIYSGGVIQVHPKWDIVIHVLGQLQGPYEQLLVGSAGRYHISEAKGKEVAIQIGTSFRMGDAVIPTFELHYAAWKIGVSYDTNISAFDNATNGNGGIEIGAMYTITNVKECVKVIESCPVF